MKNGYYYGIVIGVVAVYFVISKYVFDEVYKASRIVIDEQFHLPQGVIYCKRNFSHWDTKITTLPGLYLFSAVAVGSYFDCNSYNLRFVNLIASCINLVLFASLLRYVYYSNLENPFKIALQAVNLAILPPLYFFSHVYYTDTLSLTFLLILFRLCLSNCKILIPIFGMASICMRQTNAVWVAMILGHKALGVFIKNSRVYGNTYLSSVILSKNSLIARDIDKTKLKWYYSFNDVYIALKYHFKTGFITLIKLLTINDFIILLMHSITLAAFLGFVYYNGSIVVGDKKAHEATIHIPQMFYFLLFYGVFGLPYVLAKLLSTFKLILNNKVLFVFLGLLFLGIVHFNTIVHPYLLADNRHYTFYIWNRWYGKYDFAIYASVPVYLFLLFSLYDNLRNQNCVSFLLPYALSTFLALALQKMIEVRYFLVPYIIIRLRFVRPSMKIVIFEFLWYLSINVVVFYMFFNKIFFWKDFDYAQRLMW